MVVLIANTSLAQDEQASMINLSGKWAGTSNRGKQQMTMRLELKQEGNILEGRVGVQTLNKENAAVYLVSGFIKESVVTMKATKFEEKKANGACLRLSLNF